jgi:hypothetical protein
MKTFLFIFLLSFTTLYSQENNIPVNFEHTSKLVDTIKIKYNQYFTGQSFEYYPQITLDSILLNKLLVNNKIDTNRWHTSSIWVYLKKNNSNMVIHNRMEHLTENSKFNSISSNIIQFNFPLLNISKSNDDSRLIKSKDYYMEVKFTYYNYSDYKFSDVIEIKKIIQFTN